MMNQGIGSILDSINQALLQHVAAEQVKPVMQQISQILAPFGGTQNQPRPAVTPASGLDMSSFNPLVSPAVEDVAQDRFRQAASDAFSGPTPLAQPFAAGGTLEEGGLGLPTFGVRGTISSPSIYGIGSLLQ